MRGLIATWLFQGTFNIEGNRKMMVEDIKQILNSGGCVENRSKNNYIISYSYYLNNNDAKKEGRVHILLTISKQGRFMLSMHMDEKIHKLCKNKLSKEVIDIMQQILESLEVYFKNIIFCLEDFIYFNNN